MNANHYGDVDYFLNACHASYWNGFQARNQKPSMSDADFLADLGMDAQKWATAFAKMQAGKTVEGSGDDDDDEKVNVGTLIGWFANMIMAGYDRGYQKGEVNGEKAFLQDLQRRITTGD